MHWSDGGRRLHWSRGATLLSADLASLFANAPLDEKAPKFTPPTEGVSLSMTREAAKHEGVVVITGAKIVTMADKDGGVIENGAIVLAVDCITAVGPAGAPTLPPAPVTTAAATRHHAPALSSASEPAPPVPRDHGHP